MYSHNLAFDKATNTPMVYVNKSRAKGWHYLAPAAALRGLAEYRVWQYDEFLGLFLLICQNAALQPQRRDEKDSGKTGLGEDGATGHKATDCASCGLFSYEGSRGAVESKLRELEALKINQESNP